MMFVLKSLGAERNEEQILRTVVLFDIDAGTGGDDFSLPDSVDADSVGS
jgi:hypothetical protein